MLNCDDKYILNLDYIKITNPLIMAGHSIHLYLISILFARFETLKPGMTKTLSWKCPTNIIPSYLLISLFVSPWHSMKALLPILCPPPSVNITSFNRSLGTKDERNAIYTCSTIKLSLTEEIRNGASKTYSGQMRT